MMRRVGALLALLSIPAHAQDGPPQLDFLEYLGSWQEEDEEWFVDVELDSAQTEQQEDGANSKRAEESDE